MKKGLYISIGVTLLVIGIFVGVHYFGGSKNTPEGRVVTVDVASIVEIEPIRQLRQGFVDQLQSSQSSRGITFLFRYYNAQGEASLTRQIVDKIAIDKPDAVYVLGTPFAQAIQGRLPDTLLIQGAVTDPIAAGLATSWERSGKKYIATSDLPSISDLVTLFGELRPHGTRLGVIYDPGEVNSVAVISRLRTALKQNGHWQLIEAPVTNTADVPNAAESLTGKADLVFLPPDNTAVSGEKAIGQILGRTHIPFVATTRDALSNGAVAALALDFYSLGKSTADLYLKVLDGENPALLPIGYEPHPTLYLSKSAATATGIDLTKLAAQKNVQVSE